MKKLSPESVLTAQKNVVSKNVASEYMLLHLESGDYFGLNASGHEFWTLVDGRRTLREISAAVSKRSGVSAETAQKEALGFFNILWKYKLIDVR
ncbi:MAG TPA: PqqD family protein [Candidatus Eisenbacteria bacterium]|nr:PqqD family protein [Candidatus Eisenbacteria bacterium]